MEKLLEIGDRLLGPGGCPWDQKQTLFSLQSYLVEEMHELIEAIDEQDPSSMKEEAADLLWTLIFLSKLAERKDFFSFQDLIDASCEKLIRRHPHIFGDKSAKNAEEVVDIWNEEKKKEKKRPSALMGIPATLPLLAKAQKVVQRVRKNAPSLLPQGEMEGFTSERELGDVLIGLLARAESLHLPVEDVLRRRLNQLEKEFLDWEEKNIPETSL